jgi:hypothetical protein
MNISNQAAQEPQADDGLDRLLREYFGTKIPKTFPPLPLDAVHPAAPHMPPRSPLTRGRLILAVCVAAVLLGFGYLLSTSPVGSSQKPVGLNGSSANNKAAHSTFQSRR